MDEDSESGRERELSAREESMRDLPTTVQKTIGMRGNSKKK